jgi:hypothetical protein
MTQRLGLFIALLAMCGVTIAARSQDTGSDPFATQAKVIVKVQSGELPLKLEEKVAFMFMAAISTLEDDCKRHCGRPCTLQELVNRPVSTDGWQMRRLKFDPEKTDPNYSYKIAIDGNNWEAWANPKRSGLGGFYNTGSMMRTTYYNPDGAATAKDQRVMESTIAGDTFAVQ